MNGLWALMNLRTIEIPLEMKNVLIFLWQKVCNVHFELASSIS